MSDIAALEAACGMSAAEIRAVLDGVPIKTCANETCGAEFRIQSGRAEQGQYRTTGVMYCSRRCARAQAARAYRRRVTA